MELVAGIILLVFIGIIIDMARGRKPEFKLFHGQELKPWDDTPTQASSGDGPGSFKVTGVDRATKMDTIWHCTAASEANARVKAEMEGIVVTNISRE